MDIKNLPIEQLRLLLIQDVDGGMKNKDAHKKYGISKNTYSRYKKRYHNEGVEGLKDKSPKRTGEKARKNLKENYRPLLTRRAKNIIIAIVFGKHLKLEEKPSLIQIHKYIDKRGKSLTLNKICTILNKKLGKNYSKSTVSRFLNRVDILQNYCIELKNIVQDHTVASKKIAGFISNYTFGSHSIDMDYARVKQHELQINTLEKIYTCSERWAFELRMKYRKKIKNS